MPSTRPSASCSTAMQVNNRKRTFSVHKEFIAIIHTCAAQKRKCFISLLFFVDLFSEQHHLGSTHTMVMMIGRRRTRVNWQTTRYKYFLSRKFREDLENFECNFKTYK